MAFKRAALPNQLRVLRAERKVNQSQIAEAIGVTLDRFWKIENGKAEATDDERINLAKALGVTQADIWPNRPMDEARRTA
jgi:transcriptional regulator with XRE-family HTH domain